MIIAGTLTGNDPLKGWLAGLICIFVACIGQEAIYAFDRFSFVRRDKDGGFAIDASGALPDGRSFQGPGELASLLQGDREAFALAFTSKLLTYGLGRGLERYDRPTVKAIATQAAGDDYRFSRIVLEIVKSLPFQSRRAEKPRS